MPKKSDEQAIDFAYPLSVSASLDMPFRHTWTAHALFLERLSNHCQGVRRTFSEICTKCDAHSLFLRRIHREIASGQIHGLK
jgi:hypothetical protein